MLSSLFFLPYENHADFEMGRQEPGGKPTNPLETGGGELVRRSGDYHHHHLRADPSLPVRFEIEFFG
jgi:hypothetical protein